MDTPGPCPRRSRSTPCSPPGRTGLPGWSPSRSPTRSSRRGILKRATTEGRSDDTAEGLAQRLIVYRQDTAPVLEHYRAEGTRIVAINGVGDIDDITGRIMEFLSHDGAAVKTA